MARYQEKIKEAYLLIIGERKRAPVILSKLFSANTEISARLLYFAIAIKQQNSLRSNSCCFNIALSAYNTPLQYSVFAENNFEITKLRNSFEKLKYVNLQSHL